MDFLNGLKHAFVPHPGNGHHPHALRTGVVFSLLAAVAIVQFGAAIQILVLSRQTGFMASVLPGVLVDLTNKQRTAENLGALSQNEVLQAAAQAKANDMAAKSYFAHVSPDGVTPWYWIEAAGYSYSYAGENLAVNFSDSSDVVNAWMASPSHRANIEKPNYTDIGIATATGVYKGREAIFVVQMFGAPLVKPVAVAPIVTPQPPALDTAPVSIPAGSVQGAEVVKPAVKIKVAQADGLPLRNQDQVDPANDPVEFSDEPVSSAPVTSPAVNVSDVQTQVVNENANSVKNLAYESRSISKNAVELILGFFSVALFVALFFKFRVAHEQAIVNGVLGVAVAGLLFFMNAHYFPAQPDLPASDNGAAIALSQ